jgi:hypothetical protein
MPADILVSCTCGAVTGLVRGVTVANSRRLSCMCDDCQVYAHYLRRAGEILDVHGGTDLSYATQDRVSISAGRDHLRAVRLSQAGILRVYTGCCRTPVAHVPSPKLAFVGIPHLFLRCGNGGATRDQILGPVTLRLQGRFCRGELPEGAHRSTPLGPAAKAMARVLWDTIRGRHMPSPFHEPASGAAFPAPVVLSPGEVEALRGPLAHLPSALSSAEPAGCR